MSPLCTQMWRHVALPVSAQYCLWVSVCECPNHIGLALSMVQAVKHKTLTQYWPNVGTNIYDADQTLAHYWVTVSCLAHRAGTASMKYWLGLNGYCPTFNSHWVGGGLYSPPAVTTSRPARSPANMRRWTSAGLMLGQRRRMVQHWVSVSCLLGLLTSHIVFRT